MSQRVTEKLAVTRFREVARDFCALVDDHLSYSAPAFLRRLQTVLPNLSSAALALPAIKRPGELDNPHHYSGWKRLFDALSEQLAPYTIYREVFDPYKAEEPVNGSLADDLADLYWDIGPGLSRWDAADPATRRGIVWNWRFGYESHWGQHLVDAMRAIHTLLCVHHIEHQHPPTKWPPSG